MDTPLVKLVVILGELHKDKPLDKHMDKPQVQPQVQLQDTQQGILLRMDKLLEQVIRMDLVIQILGEQPIPIRMGIQ